MSFGDRLTNLRKSKKITQQGMADILGIARTTYASYEQGHRQPDYDTLQKIADHFDTSIDFLLTGTNNPGSDDDMWKEILDPNKKLFFKDLMDAPEEKLEEMRQIWEIIKNRDKK